MRTNLMRQAALVCGATFAVWAGAQGTQAPSRGSAKPAIANASACAPTTDDYPAAARRVFAVGSTRVRFSVGPDGGLASAEIVKSAGATREHKMLDRLAMAKLRECKFTAGVDETGRPTGASFDVEYRWRIEGAPVRTVHPYFADLSTCIPLLSDIEGLDIATRTVGTASLVFNVGNDGKVKSGRISRTSGESAGNTALDNIALSRLLSCRFVQSLANKEVTVGYHWPELIAYNGVELWEGDARRMRGESPSPLAESPAPAPAPVPAPRQAPQPAPEPASPRAKALSSGSGFVVSPGRVITNDHVVDECSAVTVRFGDADIRAEVIDSNRSNDLALLRLARTVGTPASIRTSAVLGEDVTVAGFPLRGFLGSDLIVTSGQVNATAGLGNDPTTLQISAPVQPGNSGGPLIDRTGAIVGVVFSKLDVEKLAKVTGDMAQNINFAVKPELLRLFLEANRVQYKSAGPGPRLEGVQIADRARNFTVQVLCEPK